jgi:hypothetical protein
MGCPIRSEIWACIAPGAPAIAVRYAYEDAICDHAGGESVFGELFNTAIESAAFVLSDRDQLLDIGLSYVPKGSQTEKAIVAARAAHAAGEDWKTARKRVLQATPHYNAQYSPINMGFQVIGWLYGADFGDAICKAVNCGYDTDCTGATLGSILGIIAGRSGLPRKWTEPLGESIATNESWGGLHHASSGSNPVPASLSELTDRVIVQAERVLVAHGVRDGSSDGGDAKAPRADETVQKLLAASVTQVDFHGGSISAGIDYVDTPAVLPEQQKRVVTYLSNPHPDAIPVRCTLTLPAGWEDRPAPQEVEVPAKGTLAVEWNIQVPARSAVENTQTLMLQVQPANRPAEPAAPVVLIGAHAYRYAGPFPADSRSDQELFDQTLEPEGMRGDALTSDGRAGDWTDFYALDNALPLGDVFTEAGVLYAQTFLWSEQPREAWIGAAVNCPAKMWVNGQPVVSSFRYRPVRPNYGGDKESYATVRLDQGWNEALLKFVRGEGAPRFECHLLISSADQLHNGIPEIGRTRFPWDNKG